MPLFEYRCETCRTDFELLVRNSETPACPGCASTEIEKLFSSPAAPVTGGPRTSLPVMNGCAPAGPPCSPVCCRLPQ